MIFVRQFTGFLPILIELAAIISLAVQDWTDFGIIVAILVINGTHPQMDDKQLNNLENISALHPPFYISLPPRDA